MEFLTASVASMTANVFTHPLETLKVRQMMHGGSIYSIGANVVREEGVGALYKGLNAALIRAVISGGGRLYGYSFLKHQATAAGVINHEPSIEKLPILGVFAISSACFSQFLASPIDLIRTRQAAFKGRSDNPSMLHVTKQVLQEDGFRGLFSGSTALMLRAITFNLGQLLTYDKAKAEAVAATSYSETDVRIHLLASLCAGFVATTFSCPAENVKTYGQLTGRKANVLQSLRTLWQQDGLRAFYRGWTPLYLKIAPHTVIVFVTLEGLNKMLL